MGMVLEMLVTIVCVSETLTRLVHCSLIHYPFLCVLYCTPLQRDSDEDGIGNGCDRDIDEDKDGIQDGRPDGGYYSFDNCPKLPNADQCDTDNDGSGTYIALL